MKSLERGESPIISVRVTREKIRALEAIRERTDLPKADFYRLVVDNFILRNSNEEPKS